VSNVGTGTISDFTFTGNNVIGNGRLGIYVYNMNIGTISDFIFNDNTVTGNSAYSGIRVRNDIGGFISGFTFTSNTVTGNNGDGICVYKAGTGPVSDFTFTGNTITGNINGIYLYKGTGSMSGINLGDGTLGGNNSIYNNSNGTAYFDINNASGINNLPAQYNWWGSATPLDSQFNGPVDYSNSLSSLP
jgi:hypothetical protein